MRVTLIHNPGAGAEDQPDAKKLRKLAKAAGHKVKLQSSKEKGWAKALKKRADLVAVAGGDGTVSRVARLMARRGTPLTVLPLGTANNIARSLGIADQRIEDLIAGWEGAARIPFDTARARGPWGRRRMIEGVGIGLFAWTMPQANDSKKLAKIGKPEQAVAHALQMLADRLAHFRPIKLRAKLDGKDISGKYVLLEAINLQYIGPNLHLAPGVRAGDGLLHVVAVTEAQRERLGEYLEKWRRGRRPRVKLTTYKGRRLEIRGKGFEVHLDDKLWDPRAREGADAAVDIELQVEPAALQFLVPKRRK